MGNPLDALGGGGDDTAATTSVRYAPYLESYHQNFLGQSYTIYGDSTRVREASPYLNYEERDYDDAFFGVGYDLSTFPSLYGTFTQYLFDLNFEDYFNIVLSSVKDGANLTELSEAQGALITSDINQNALPKFCAGMRDINSVVSSSFVIGASLIEQGGVMQLASYNAEMKYKLLPIAVELYGRKLAWNVSMVSNYSELFKLMVDTKTLMADNKTTNAYNHAMWPFTVLAQERANLGALQGAITQSTEKPEGSKTSGVLGGAMSGAAMGSYAGPWGAVIGGVAGGLLGLLKK